MKSGGAQATGATRSRQSGALVLGALLVAAAFAIAPPAIAADTAPPSPEHGVARRAVSVDWGPCDPLGEIASILRVELESRLVDGPALEDAYRTTITCMGGLIAISVGLPGGPSESFQTNLAGTPVNVRARIIALALAELVRDLDRAPHPAVPLPPPPPPPPFQRESAAASPTLPAPARLGAFAQTSNFELNGAWLAGGGLRFEYNYRGWVVGLDGTFLALGERFDLGTAQVMLAYGSPHTGWAATWGHLEARLGAGYALGAASLSGHATGTGTFGGTTTGPWAAPYAFAALAFAITDRIRVDAGGQLGWVTSPVVGQVGGGEEIELKGLLISFQAGLAIAL